MVICIERVAVYPEIKKRDVAQDAWPYKGWTSHIIRIPFNFTVALTVETAGHT